MLSPALTAWTALAYLCAAVLLYRRVQRAEAPPGTAPLALLLLGLAGHAWLLALDWQDPAGPGVGITRVLSLCAGVMLVLLAITAILRRPGFLAALVALPLAALLVVLDSWQADNSVHLSQLTANTRLHVISSLLAFGLLGLAAIYAVFISLLDRLLRHHRVTPLVQALPPLEVLEHLLAQLVFAGFLLLSVSLVSGFVYLDNPFAQHLVHKTVLSILAWLVFGLLLLGRWRYGWRGRRMVRLTLAGMALLLLSYFGSKLVLEQVLGQRWQA